MNYSYEERKIGTWINGEDLYEKSIVLEPFTFNGSQTTGDYTTFQHNIPNIKQGWVHETILYPNPNFEGTPSTNFENSCVNILAEYQFGKSLVERRFIWHMKPDELKLYTIGMTIANEEYNALVVLRYTKTTDTI